MKSSFHRSDLKHLSFSLSSATRVFVLCLFSCLALSFSGAALPAQAPSLASESLSQLTPSDVVAGSLILKVKPEFRSQCNAQGIQIPSLNSLMQDWGVFQVKQNFPNATDVSGQTNDLGQALVDISLIYEFRVPDVVDVLAMASTFSQHEAIAYAEPRIQYEVFLTPNDPFLGNQWYLNTIGAYTAWDSVQGDTSITIGIIDTGTNFSHPDLFNQVYYNLADPVDGIDNDGDGYLDNYRGWDFGGANYWAPQDNDPSFVGSAPGMDHGVLVTGAACAQLDNGIGVAGLGYNTQYIPLKAGVDQSISISYGMEAVVYGADQGINILNLSWGSSARSQYGQDIVNYATINQGCLVVAAAGNRFNYTYVYPASYENVISTGSTELFDNVWDYGNGTGTTYNYWVDICAPGRNIPTTTGSGSYWNGSTGTSMSAPLVCAAAALVKAYLPNLNNIQAGEYVRVTAEDVYGTNAPFLTDQLGLGRLDMENIVQATNVKSLRIDSMMVRDDENDLPESLDTMDVYARFINYLDPISNLTVTLSSPDTNLIEVIQDTYTIPSMGTLTSETNVMPFTIRIKENVNVRTLVFLKFAFSDGTYQDYQYFRLIINPIAVHLDENQVHTSVNGNGNFGFSDHPYNTVGLGWRYGGANNLSLDAGFIMGISQNKLVDVMKADNGKRNERLHPIAKPDLFLPGATAQREVATHFDDSQAGTHELGIDVAQHCYQFTGGYDEKYIIMEYTLTNKNNFPINDLYAGLGNQWNNNGTNLSNANYHPNGNFVGAQANYGGLGHAAGITMLTDQTTNAYSEGLTGYGYTDAEKFQALTNPSNNNSVRSGPVIQFISAGPFDLAPGASKKVAFALIGGSDLNDLATVSATAKQKYWCEIRNEIPQVDLGQDFSVCTDDTGLPTLTPTTSAGVSYLWSNSDTTSSTLALTSGVYGVTVTNAYGCVSNDDVNVILSSLGNPSLGLGSGPYYNGIAVDLFLQNTELDQAWNWDFGDGLQSNGDTSYAHIYQNPGNYTISVMVDNGICSQTLDTLISVSSLVSLQNPSGFDFQAFPNPFSSFLTVTFNHDVTGDLDLQLYDLNGRLVRSSSFAKDSFGFSGHLSTDGLANGSYFLKLTLGQDVVTQLLIHE